MTEEDQLRIKTCLVQCARRLRHYEHKHRALAATPQSLVESIGAENDAKIDGQLAEMAEALISDPPPDLVAKEPDPG